MGGFSAFAAEKGVNLELCDEEVAYLVDNSELRSAGVGIRFRRSTADEDKLGELAPFDSIVRGVPVDSCRWLRVGPHYLPMEVEGKRVLRRAFWTEPGFEGVGRPREAEEEPSDDEQHEALLDDPGSAQFREELRRWSSVKSPLPYREVLPGAGAEFEVHAERVLIRAAPSRQARACGSRKKGQVVELFDWDETRSWRRTLLPGIQLGSEPAALQHGWMMLDHKEVGPLLRPKGYPFSVRPLEPLCMAAREACPEDLQRFVDSELFVDARGADGLTPLMSAAQQGSVHCCFLLLRAGANPRLLSPGRRGESAAPGATAAALAGSEPCRAFIEALSGRDFHVPDFDAALDMLPDACREEADALFDRVTQRLANQRMAELDEATPETKAEARAARASEKAAEQAERQKVLARIAELEVEKQEAAACEDYELALEIRQEIQLLQESISGEHGHGAGAGATAQPPKGRSAPAPRVLPGDPWEVVFKAVCMRAEPHLKAEEVGWAPQGTTVYVLDYDSSERWAMAQFDRAGVVLCGWMLMVSDDIGELIRPRR